MRDPLGFAQELFAQREMLRLVLVVARGRTLQLRDTRAQRLDLTLEREIVLRSRIAVAHARDAISAAP